jgi:HSP20 family protein
MYNKRSYAVLPNTVGGLMEDIFQKGWNHINEEVRAFGVPVNIQETDKSYELHVVAPGLKKEDFKITTDKNILNISFEHKEENKEQATGSKWLRNEYHTRSFKRSFTMNEKVDSTSIGAKYTDGILLITLPKKEVAEPTVQEISVN